jgi:hypothetical protein
MSYRTIVNDYIKRFKGGQIPQVTYDIIIDQLVRETGESKSKITRTVKSAMTRNSIGLLPGIKRESRPPEQYESKVFNRDTFRRELVSQRRRQLQELRTGTASQRRQALKQLTSERQGLIERGDRQTAEGAEYIRELKKRRQKQLEEGEISYGQFITAEDERIAGMIQDAVYTGYRTAGVRVRTGRLINSLKVSAVYLDGEIRYVLESDVPYAKYVDGYTDFTRNAKELTIALTGTELIIRFV